MRARNIKPSLFKNEELADLGPYAVVLFEGLWCMADREGRLEDRPRRIKAEIMPYWDVDVDDLLGSLQDAGFITRYVSGENRFIQVVNFTKHQHPHVKEAASTIPAPDEHSASTVQAPEEHDTSPSDPGFPLIDSPSRIPEVATKKTPQSSSAETVEKPYEIYVAFCEEIGADESELAPSFKKQQTGIAKQLLEDGFGSERVRRCIRYLQSQDWRTSPIDLRTVKKEIGRWEANGEPIAATQSKNGRSRNQPDYSGHDEFNAAFDAIEQRGPYRGP